MLQGAVTAIREAYSGAAAKQYVAAISQYHRLQASPGHRAAAEYCLAQLRSWGLDADVLSFPADEETVYWTCRSFKEWSASEATLDLLRPEGPRRLADYREDKISLIQRSLPFEGEVEVAVVEGGAADPDYEGLDVAGKVVLAGGDVQQVYRLAVQQRGAVGILFDGMRDAPPVRQRIDLPDARQYTSFWWHAGDEPRCFGFVLTPRQGDELRALARERALRVRAKVVSRLYDGHLEVVSALIPGQSEEEVLIVAHLCHPQPSANDNASGAGAILEAAHTLQSLIGSGRLPQPRRGIRLLWVPEMTGTYAYLASREQDLEQMVAGINLDMVGQNQDLCGSTFVVERPPEAMASFAPELLISLRDMLQEGARSLGGTADLVLYRQTVTPFSGGSDHYILSDPTVGVPTPMLIQWPDRFYHTSADTIDKVDPRMLAVLGRLATAYAYIAASAGEVEARWLARGMVARGKGALAQLAQEAYTEAVEAKDAEALAAAAVRGTRRLAFRAGRVTAGLRSLLRLAPGLGPVVEGAAGEVGATAEAERLGLERELAHLAREMGLDELPPAKAEDGEWEARAERTVLRRLYRGPAGLSEILERLEPAERAAAGEWSQAQLESMHSLPALAQYWLDGRRNLREVADMVEGETGQRPVELLVRLGELMEHAGLVENVAS